MNIQEKISYINALAIEISHENKAHVFTNYSGHVNLFQVRVNSIETEYFEGGRKVSLYNAETYLEEPEAAICLDGMIHTLLKIKRTKVVGVAA